MRYNMEHVAIMRKSWRLTGKILKGEKKIESRWYKVKYRPWDRIKIGEFVYFKDSGDPITLKAEVEKVIQFQDLTPIKVKEILYKYGKDDGINSGEINYFFEIFKDKRYCMLIFLNNPVAIEPFDINKKGFGAMSAWISIDDVSKIKISK